MDLNKELTSIFYNVFDDDTIELSRETTANDVDGWDSLSHANLILAIENHFNIKLTLKEIRRLKNVGDLLDIISSKLP